MPEQDTSDTKRYYEDVPLVMAGGKKSPSSMR